MNPFRCMVTVGDNARLFLYNSRLSEREPMAKPCWEVDMQCDKWDQRQARSYLPLQCLWQLWWSMTTLMQPFHLDQNVFCWWIALAYFNPISPGIVQTDYQLHDVCGLQNIVMGQLVSNEKRSTNEWLWGKWQRLWCHWMTEMLGDMEKVRECIEMVAV
jgi:hypothetical protein